MDRCFTQKNTAQRLKEYRFSCEWTVPYSGFHCSCDFTKQAYSVTPVNGPFLTQDFIALVNCTKQAFNATPVNGPFLTQDFIGPVNFTQQAYSATPVIGPFLTQDIITPSNFTPKAYVATPVIRTVFYSGYHYFFEVSPAGL